MENNYKGEEKRERVRTNIEAALRFLVFDTHDSGTIIGDDALKVFSGVINNISEKGACIRTNDLQDKWHSNLLAGKIILSMKFKLDGFEKAISAMARVRWIRIGTTKSYRHALGVDFMDMRDNEKKIISDYVIKNIAKDN